MNDRQLAGAVVVVARAGRVVLFEAVGHQDAERNVPLRPDTIFRLASMPKAVTSVAAVILFEIVEHVGRSGRPGSAGAYGWGSAYDSTYWVDPAEQLVAVCLTQLIPTGGLDLRDRFRYRVYQAIVGPPSSPPPAPRR